MHGVGTLFMDYLFVATKNQQEPQHSLEYHLYPDSRKILEAIIKRNPKYWQDHQNVVAYVQK